MHAPARPLLRLGPRAIAFDVGDEKFVAVKSKGARKPGRGDKAGNAACLARLDLDNGDRVVAAVGDVELSAVGGERQSIRHAAKRKVSHWADVDRLADSPRLAVDNAYGVGVGVGDEQPFAGMIERDVVRMQANRDF